MKIGPAIRRLEKMRNHATGRLRNDTDGVIKLKSKERRMHEEDAEALRLVIPILEAVQKGANRNG